MENQEVKKTRKMVKRRSQNMKLILVKLFPEKESRFYVNIFEFYMQVFMFHECADMMR